MPALVDPLLRERCIVIDLLVGRSFRLQAEKLLNTALQLEATFPEYTHLLWQIDDNLVRAARLEEVAAQAEQGIIYWGGRMNRDGRCPEDFDSPRED